MASQNDQFTPLRAARQLRRMRAFYTAGVVLWTASSIWTGWDSPGSRPMWTSLLLLAVFAALLGLACNWLRGLDGDGEARAAHHAAPRRAPAIRHTSA
ncbi:hypothetical protein ACIRJO_16815 [Streptomyces sp. NPDC102394]|uniref:hypothetical protein n=1 Tax=Streptomyces sp. NPDC102394 TaxID=3366167 RepID=UPI003806F261